MTVKKSGKDKACGFHGNPARWRLSFFRQIDSSELIRGREMVARSLSTPRAPLPANTVYICHALQLLAPAPRPPRASSGMPRLAGLHRRSHATRV